MAIKARTPGKSFFHRSVYDTRPEEAKPTDENPNPDNSAYKDFKPTRWGLRVLDSRVIGILKDKATKLSIDPTRPDEEIATSVGQNDFYFQVCQFGITEDTENYEVRYKSEKRNIGGKSYPIAAADWVSTIPEHIISELAERILEGNSLSEDEGNA
jgi:hypothetical protein